MRHLNCKAMNFVGDWCRDGDFASIDGTNLVLRPPLDAEAGGWYPLYVTVRAGYYRRNNVVFVRVPEKDFDFCPRGLPGADFDDLKGL